MATAVNTRRPHAHCPTRQVPLPFPQFAEQGSLPLHGFARTSAWHVLSTVRAAWGTQTASHMQCTSHITVDRFSCGALVWARGLLSGPFLLSSDWAASRPAGDLGHLWALIGRPDPRDLAAQVRAVLHDHPHSHGLPQPPPECHAPPTVAPPAAAITAGRPSQTVAFELEVTNTDAAAFDFSVPANAARGVALG